MRAFRSVATLLLFILFPNNSSGAATIWDGPPITFTKGSFADWTLPRNQDHITPRVSLTRADDRGIFNIEVEPLYEKFKSPLGTEWAYGTTSNYASLTYKPWELWAGQPPTATVGKDAVVHLIEEDIYIDIKFTAFGGAGAGGNFSYIRTTIPEPAGAALLASGAVMLAARRRQRPGG
jgi:hypothetical protein